MPKAIKDPIEVRRFAAELKRFNDDLHSQMVSLHSRFSALGDSSAQTAPNLGFWVYLQPCG